MLHDGTARAASLRQRADAMLEAGQISNLVSAQWQDQALATESLLVDLELQRLDAETRLKQLLGDRSAAEVQVALDINQWRAGNPAGPDRRDRPSSTTDLVVQRRRLALDEALALHRPQVLLSGFAGVASVPHDEGTFGIYGLRVSLSLPMFEGTAARRIAEAKIQLEEAERARDLAAAAEQNRADLLRLAAGAAEKRIALLEQAVDVARRREESVVRLVRAGVRPESELVDVTTNIARREADLLAVRVERWKLQQQMNWGAGGRAQGAGDRAAVRSSSALLPPAPCALRPDECAP
jgi:outer membrane protein TolC